MKKILILANDHIGLYNFRKELLKKLLDEGYEVYISLPKGERVTDMQDMGCIFVETAIDRRGTNVLSDFKLFARYLSMLKNIKPDIIISYTIKPNMYGGLATRLFKMKFYPYVAGLGTPFQKQNLLTYLLVLGHRVAFKNSQYVFFENRETMEYYIKKRIVNSNCVKIPGAGVNLEEYSFMELPQGENCHFVFVGRIMKEKGIDELLEASKKIKEKYPHTDINIVGSYEEDYSTILKKLTKEQIIRYWGFQKDVKPILTESHCLVLPSYHEGMANVLLEAAAMGRILVTSNICGCKEAVVDSETGYLVPRYDAIKLYEAMEKVILLSPKEKKEMSIKSRKHIEDHFDRNLVVQTIVKHVTNENNKL